MVQISLTFICAFPLAQVKEQKGKKGKKDKPKKEKKGKKGKKTVAVPVILKENCIAVQSIDNFVHIEYNLLPNKSPCVIDVVSWGPVTKVCVRQDVTLLRSMKSENYYWAAFSVDHVFNLSSKDVKELKTHEVSITMLLSKNKVSDKARNDKTKEFFVNMEDWLHNVPFAEAFIDEGTEKMPSQGNLKKLYPVDATGMYQILYKTPADVHLRRVLDVINKVVLGKVVDCMNSDMKEYVFVEKAKDKKGKGKKEKKKKGKKVKDMVAITFPAELFFTDPSYFSLLCKDENNKLPKSFVLVTVTQLLTPAQVEEFNPFTIKIDRLLNFPDYILQGNNFVSVFATCSVGNLMTYPVGEREISKNIIFKSHKTYFLNESDQVACTETIQWGYLTIILYGRKVKKRSNLHILFGKIRKDYLISKHLTKNLLKLSNLNRSLQDCVVVPLCVCLVKLDSFLTLKSSTTLSRLEHCVHPEHISVQMKDFFEDFTNALNPVSADVLLKNFTALEVEVRLSKPFEVTKEVRQFEPLFKRIVLVINNKPLAKTMLTQVLVHNQNYMEKKTVISSFQDIGGGDNVDHSNVVTGFIVDFDELFIMFFEGLVGGIVEQIWCQMKLVHKFAAKVFYNSDLIYSKRLYEDLIPFGGVYTVTLQMGFSLMICNKNMFLKGIHSDDCRKALQKLVMIRRSRVLAQISENTLPTVKEIRQLNQECGIPLINRRICNCELCSTILQQQ